MTSIASLAASALGIRPTVKRSRLLMRAMAVVLGSSLLWASAKVQVPFWPVPMTMQTYVVLSLGALLGWRLGALTVAFYLVEGALGLPVFAGTPANGIGLAYMAGTTGGYLAGYLVAVALVGMLAERGWDRSIPGIATALLAGEIAIIGFGCGWLAVQFGWETALAVGFGPFLIGDVFKLLVAGATIIYGRRLRSTFAR
jgi:biotin transport system substrate-specific component